MNYYVHIPSTWVHPKVMSQNAIQRQGICDNLSKTTSTCTRYLILNLNEIFKRRWMNKAAKMPI